MPRVVSDLWRLSLTDALAQGAAAEDVVASCYSRIAVIEPELHAWVHLAGDAPVASGGPFGGLPVGVKDVIDTADMPTELGAAAHRGRRPSEDAACVTLLRRAGATVLGKTVTTELASFSPGPTSNPHDPDRTPGGSSSGSAAAVAAGMVPVAYGTQTAGSVIRPASFCGVVGFKPRHGWVSTAGVKRLSARLDTLGTFGRTVADAARLAGFEPAAGEPRIAFCRTPWVEAAPEAEEAARRVGARELELPPQFASLAAAQKTVMAFDVARNLEPEWREHREGLSQVMQDYIARGQEVPEEDAEAAVALRDQCRARLPEVLAGLDALLVPAALGEAPLRSEGHTGDPLLCRAWTLLGVPAISVPGLTGPAGMPVGVQLVGLDEAAVLGAAATVEAALA